MGFCYLGQFSLDIEFVQVKLGFLREITLFLTLRKITVTFVHSFSYSDICSVSASKWFHAQQCTLQQNKTCFFFQSSLLLNLKRGQLKIQVNSHQPHLDFMLSVWFECWATGYRYKSQALLLSGSRRWSVYLYTKGW